jgi:hypothetical protein
MAENGLPVVASLREVVWVANRNCTGNSWHIYMGDSAPILKVQGSDFS